MRTALLTAACAPVLASGARAQDLAGAGAALPLPEQPGWLFDLALYQYFVPGDADYLQPTLTADRGRLHLEARYNYEDFDTASVWAGYNLGFGDELSLELTPMLGAAFGDTFGALLGYRGALDWGRFELYSEGEYLHDLDDSSDSYFFTWSELTVSPVDGLRAGLAVQRTRVYESELNVQRGLLLGLDFERVSFTVNVFNPDRDDPVWVVALQAGW